ncbi:MAG: hypothetical protein ACKVT1_02430 [Dehalococcoidia bacterium]
MSAPDVLALEAAAALEKGADYIEEHGWRQGEYGMHGGPVCLDGALDITSAGDDIVADRAALAVDGWLYRRRFEWNDDPGRTKEQVTEAMRAVAASLRGQPVSYDADGCPVRQHVLNERMTGQREDPDESDYALTEEQADERARFDAAAEKERTE